LGLSLLVSGCVALNMPGRSFDDTSAAGRNLETRERLGDHVSALAADIGERNLLHPGSLDRAARYVRGELERSGYEVREQEFRVGEHTVATRQGGRPVPGGTVRNLEARLTATSPPSEIVVVGAHYDTVLGSPGADDNASGVAALLELARRLRQARLGREVRFAFFVNEEAPYYGADAMGSLVYARACKEVGDRVVAMLSLETLGYYSDTKGSQRIPWFLRPFYPSRGNFVAFVSDTRSRSLVRRTVRAFRGSAQVGSRGAAVPRWVEGVAWSDHWSFWQMGYPALMVTDTAFLRNPHYHTAGDLPPTLDLDRLAEVVEGLAAAVQELATGP
jgi:hypothetical protein